MLRGGRDPGPTPRPRRRSSYLNPRALNPRAERGLILAIRLYRLGEPSLWLDEAYSFWFATRDWAYLWTQVPQFETHPSFYYSLLKLWTGFGTSEFVLRLLSVAINVATIPLVALLAWLCGDRQSGRPAAILAAILFACSATQVHAAQEARPYALMTLGMAMAIASAVAAMTGGPRARAPMRRMLRQDRPMAAAFAGIGIGIALLGWSHNYGLVFATILGACLFGWWLAQGALRGLLANLLISVGIALLLYAPNLLIVLMQTQSLNSRGFWVEIPTLKTVGGTILKMPLGHAGLLERPEFLAAAMLSLVLALAGLAAMIGPARRLPRAVPLTLFVMATVPAVVSFVLSHLGQPIFLFRTLQPSQVPMVAGLAFAPLTLRRLLTVRAQGMAFVLPVLLAVTAMWHSPPGRQDSFDEDWRALTRAIAAASAPMVPKLVIFPVESELPFLYYTPGWTSRWTSCRCPAPIPPRAPITIIPPEMGACRG